MTMDSDRHTQNLMSCVHCGLCLPSCPTYLETGSEADSPRGRIVLMRRMHEGTLSPGDPDVERHLDLCLGCRACETACPSAVPYGELLETARERVRSAGARSKRTAVSRKAFLKMLTTPSLTRAALRAAGAVGATNMPGPVSRWLSGQDSAHGIGLPVANDTPLPPAITPAVGVRRARVGVLTGCVMRVLYGDVNQDTVRVLAANGCETLVNQRQGCCGALHLHSGFHEEGVALAKRLIDAFTPLNGLDAIIANSAGCGSTLKDYGRILADDPEYAARAHEFASKIQDISEFLDGLGWVAPMRDDTPASTAAYHDACHLAHAQQIREAPRRLLALVPNLTLVPLAEGEICCGSAGIYNVTEPEMAARLQQRKVEAIRATKADTVVTGNPGCLAWINSGLQEYSKSPVRVVHPVTLLAEALTLP
jgi:glycolate oxidase iron-sulfur subunit